jgi:multisubunit Na+/H+ antiporter MnhE subunit
MIRPVCVVFSLTVIYACALASADPLDLLFGALLATGLVVLFRASVTGEAAVDLASLIRRTGAFLPFAGAILYDIFVGTWAVILIVLHLRPLRRPGIVAVPIGERTPTGVAVSAFATTLSPGSYLIDVDWERGVMLLHVLDASDPDAVERAHQRFYDRFQRHVFP